MSKRDKAPATPKIDIGISAKDRAAIAQGLSRLLADSFTLYLMTHNFHWNVTGPQFNSLHQMFMVQYTEQWNALNIILTDGETIWAVRCSYADNRFLLNYQTYDRLPIVHFGFWEETLEKWVAEGHLRLFPGAAVIPQEKVSQENRAKPGQLDAAGAAGTTGSASGASRKD